MHFSRYLTTLLLFGACAVTCTGCFLLPSNQVSHQVVIQTEAAKVYDLAIVTRGDVVRSQKIYCTYSELTELEYAFTTPQLSVKYVYVSVGDAVSKGDVLAKLDTSSLDSQREGYVYDIDKLTLQLSQTKELKEFDLNALSKSYKDGLITKETYHNEKESITNRYQATIDSYEESLYIDGLRLAQIEEKLAGAYIYASIDGTISYVATNLQDSNSVKDQVVIREVDTGQCAFAMTDDEYVSYFEEGQIVTLVDNSKNEYEASVMMLADDEGANHVYFLPTDTTAELAVGTKASFNLVFEESKDVLMVPSSTIHVAGDQYFVYCQDENGIKTLHYVTIGLKGNSYTEIKDGLSEGDAIIK